MKINRLFCTGLFVFIVFSVNAQTEDNDPHNDPRITTKEEFNKYVHENAGETRDAATGGYDQLIKNTTPISPQAESIQKFGEFPMDYSTGVPHISIPLYEIKVGNYRLPITISYHASGIKVQDMATPVGLGWTLNAGGVVNRQCKGTADEIQDTLLLTYKTESEIDYAMASGARTNYWWSRLAHKGEGDTESDRYIFSINGKSSVFRYCVTDHSLRTIPTSDVKIEHIQTGGYLITDSDGTKYYFTYGETNSDYNSSTLTATTTWYITRIEPSSSTIPIEFSYTSGRGYTMSYITQMDNNGTSYEMVQGMYGDYELTENQFYSDFYQSYGGLYHGTVLLSQITWANNTISFVYAQDRLERGWSLDRLSSMAVKYNNQTVRTVTFDNNHYLGSSQSNYRMQLQGITIQGTNSTGAMTYGFSYDSTTLPNYFIVGGDQTCHEDYWGYYNGTNQSWIPSDDYLTTSSSSNRAPNAYMTAGTLTCITYPTGGTAQLVMEPNVLNDNRTWGGLRVKEIKCFDSDGTTIISKRNYQYEQGYPAQDFTDELYSYDVDYYYGYRANRGLQWGIGEHTINQSSSLLSLTGDWGHPVYYRKVTETIDGHGKTEYFYDVKRPSLNNMEDNGHIYDPLRLYSVQYNFDQGTINPTLTAKNVYAQDGSPKSSESYTYTEKRQVPFRVGLRFEESNVLINYGGIAIDDAALDNSEFHHEFVYSDVWAVPSLFMLTSKSVTDYNNQVTTTTTYTYQDSLKTHQPISESMIVSNGQTLKTTFTYPITTNPIDSSLVAANMHVPIGTKTKRDTAVVDSTRTTYGLYSGLYLPSSLYIGKGDNAPEKRIQYDYDSFGNLANAVKDDTIKTVFLWGYHGLHPVAKVEGMTKQDVYTTLGSTITTLAGNPSDSQVHGIHTSLTSGLVTTYAWTPLVGITSMQSPRGENTYFTYNTMGHLASIHDHSNNVIESYTYNYGTQSYVRRHTMTNSSGTSYRETTDYYDGLGRKSETVAKGQSPTNQDLVTLTEYDALDRPIREWLPTVFSNTGSYITPCTYTSGTRSYYESDSKPYSLTEYELCPSDKALKQFGPGNDWQSNDKAVTKNYRGNTTADNVLIYEVTSSGSALKCTGSYPAGELFVIQTTSEDENISYSFTDKEGRLILERRMADSEQYDTYHVYDIYGNLAFVLPPAASDVLTATNTTWDISTENTLQQYAYHYQYDSRNRCIKKYLPGCDYISMTYDTADRMITRQDGNQRNSGGSKTYYIYDKFGRQTEMGTQTSLGIPTPLLTNYYDTYPSTSINDLDYNSSGGSDPAFSTTNAKGLLTGTKTAQLNNTSTDYYTLYYYGQRERLVQSHAQNHLSGFEHDYYTYNFIGTTATHKHVHSASGQTTQTELYNYTYDVADRLTGTTYQLNNNTAVTLGINTYDDVGRLFTKKPMNQETVTYGYNVRSWLQNISSTNFEQTLSYHTAPSGGLTPNYPKYDGSISAMTWRTGNDTDVWGYRFRYYPTGWLRSASTRLNGRRVYDYDTFYDYDKMGNMEGFYRYGVVDKDLDLYDFVDYPSLINYDGNQVTRIDDNDFSLTYPYNGGYHFIDYVQQNNEYVYDKNGNMTQDLNKRISSIQYNLLNLPTNITYSTGSTIAYTYDAAGKKLHVAYGSPNSTTDYCGNMIYENGALKQILIDDGYVTFSGTTPVYHYYLKDHQGNNRVVLNASGTIEQVNHYFPYGYLYGESTNSGVQPYKYNGKEFDMMHGLHWYDYGARHYDPCIMRFTTMDPMCEKYYNISPYAYCGNNPVNAVDPSGMDIWDIDSYGQITNHIGTEDFDKIRVLNAKGSIIAQTENFIYGTISHQTIKHENGNYELFQIKGDSNGRDVFETFAKNTDVEWSLAQFDDTSAIPNILTTSHMEDSDHGINNYLFHNNSYVMSLNRLDHNHPGLTTFPSFSINEKGEFLGDMGMVYHFNDYYPNNHIKYNIYTLNNGKWGYYNYNENTIINNGKNNNLLPNIIKYGNKK